jgi:hypothetical protein
MFDANSDRGKTFYWPFSDGLVRNVTFLEAQRSGKQRYSREIYTMFDFVLEVCYYY